MLKRLSIKNYALIESLDLEPVKGFNAFTGETGAGKSIVLGALGMLAGAKFDGKILLNDEAKCIIEASFLTNNPYIDQVLDSFDLDKDQELVIRREFSPGGKSRIFINDSPSSLEALKALGPFLLDIHSQHDTLQLANAGFQRSVVDGFGNFSALKASVGDAYKVYKIASDHLEELKQRQKADKSAAQVFEEEWKLINQFQPKVGEQLNLEEELKRLEHSGLIGEKLLEAHNWLEAGDLPILDALRLTKGSIEKIAPYQAEANDWLERIETIRLDLKDLSETIYKQLQKVDTDPNRQEWVSERLGKLYSLLKRLNLDSEDSLIERAKLLKSELDLSGNIEGLIEAAQKEETQLKENLLALCRELTTKRKIAAKQIEDLMGEMLASVGIPNGILKIEFNTTEPNSQGADKIEFYFSANKGVAPKELKNVASGGEFSRLMLCLKAIGITQNENATLIFDEIDSGVSGKVAVQVAQLIKQLSEKRQVWVITHLPQMAAKADAHYYVFKDHSQAKTVSKIKVLSQEEKVSEIAIMISGTQVTEAALQSAKELIGVLN